MQRNGWIWLIVMFIIGACTSPSQNVAFQATQPTVAVTAPVYTVTPTRTWTLTHTPTPTITPSLTYSPAPTATDTPLPTATDTPQPTLPPTLTPTDVPSYDLITLTPPLPLGAPAAYEPGAATLSETTGWSCGDFPCEDDIDGFMRRIRVPEGFTLEHMGRFPGQVQQIAYGNDDRLYATVLENGTRNGAVYVLDEGGSAVRFSGDFVSPLGLAFQPVTGALYVSARVTLERGGGIWRIPPGGGDADPLVTDLPCCFSVVDNQPNGMIFGRDGYLYVGVGSLTDTTENPPRSNPAYHTLEPNEAAVLRVNPSTGAVEVFASGIRNPFDLALDSVGRLYATDDGILAGPGDRLLELEFGANYGFPYWRDRGCEGCPIKPGNVTVSPDLVTFAPYTLPRGITVYTGTQFPVNLFDNLFVALWNGIEGGQRIVRIDPDRLNESDYAPEPFVTGLIRPVDVVVAPDGSLVVADYVYGHVWRIRYAPG